MRRNTGANAPTVRSEQWPLLGIDPHEIVFDNGFRIVLVEDHRVPRVAASLQYRFGALSERNGEHGTAHFLEHVIHQGTTTVGVKDRDLDRRLLRALYETEQELLAERNAHRNAVRERNVFYDEGDWPTTEREQELRRKLYELEDEQAKNRIFWEEYNWYRRHGGLMRHSDPVPANTGNELLRIEVDLPRERMEMFFRLEADRMVNAVLRGWEAQRFTVLEQFFVLQRNEIGRFQEALNGVTGVAHPIYIHTGGHERDHAYWNRASMLRLYDEYIVPNNATLTLIGDMTVDEARSLGAKYFGRVPRAPAPPADMDVEAEPPPGGSVRLDWLEPIEPAVLIRYRIPGVGHPDRPAFDVVARLLRGCGRPAGVVRTATRRLAGQRFELRIAKHIHGAGSRRPRRGPRRARAHGARCDRTVPARSRRRGAAGPRAPRVSARLGAAARRPRRVGHAVRLVCHCRRLADAPHAVRGASHHDTGRRSPRGPAVPRAMEPGDRHDPPESAAASGSQYD